MLQLHASRDTVNDVQWEYILLHSIPKEWVPMTDDQNTKEDDTSDQPGTSERNDEKTGTEEREEVSGNTASGSKATNTVSDTNGNQTHTHGTGQGTDTKSGGRVPSGGSGNSPGKPDVIPTGDFGKNSDGSWRTREVKRKSFGFQKRIRERKIAEGQKG